MYGKGISRDGEIIDVGVKYGIITKGGSWYYYGENRLAQGRDNVKELMRTNKELADEISAKIFQRVKEDKEKMSQARAAIAAAAPAPSAPAQKPITKAQAAAKLDIIIDDDDED
jgi:recombination protein RecA